MSASGDPLTGRSGRSAASVPDGLAFLRGVLAGVEAVADLLYPRNCPACGGGSDRPGRHLCWSCFGGLDLFRGPVCIRCGMRPEGWVEAPFTCGACRASPPAFEAARSAARFSGALREMLHAFKYNQALWLREDLVDLLEGGVLGAFDPGKIDAVIPVPLHPARLRKRTYNQSAELARSLARRLEKPCLDVLRRVRDTAPQTRLGASARRTNMRNAFQPGAPEWIAGRRWLLVDDVMTTGATLRECAAALRRSGARRVWAVTVSRGG